MTERRHIVILGAGPGGYVAAIRAAQLGAQVTVVENQALGGVCLNRGCIPSKALLSVIEVGEKAKKATEMGLTLGGPVGYDLARMIARKDQVVAGLVKGIAALFKAWDITHVEGTGALLNGRTVRVTRPDGSMTDIGGDAVVIATGSSWPNLPLFPIDGKQVITSKEALELTDIPGSLLIVGAGVEGCEFAALYSGLGTKVSMVELMPRILPQEDEEIAGILARELKKRKVDVHVEMTVEKMERDGSAITAWLRNGSSIRAEKLLVSVGRGFNSTGIGLEAAGVQCGRRGEILVNERMETNVPGVYAIGDVVGKFMLAHVASAQGKVAVENILGHARQINYEVIPAGIFTFPEIGRVGLTEAQARERVIADGLSGETGLKVGRFRYGGLGKAQAIGDATGLFKIISHAQSGQILGVHIIGSHAADLIHEASFAMEVGARAEQVANMIHAHPTLSEGLMEAAEDVEGMAIHMARRH
jgi:dihydrolipoamide dehydrogenase